MTATQFADALERANRVFCGTGGDGADIAVDLCDQEVRLESVDEVRLHIIQRLTGLEPPPHLRVDVPTGASDVKWPTPIFTVTGEKCEHASRNKVIMDQSKEKV